MADRHREDRPRPTRTCFDLFCRGETKGIFQFESGGMQDLLMKMKPDRIEDLIAANALYRPGPMELIPHLLQPQARPRGGAAGASDHGRDPGRDLRRSWSTRNR